jgi:hypothetical protein
MDRFRSLHKALPRRFLLCLLWLLAVPVLAHEVEVKQDVAITFHIDPNDHPTVNQPAKAWFLVTLQGGKVVPLSACNCELAVYAPSALTAQRPWIRPTLSAFSSDRRKDLMAASIIFPKVGLYELKLTGRPKTNAHFKPFAVSYKVTVTPG